MAEEGGGDEASVNAGKGAEELHLEELEAPLEEDDAEDDAAG